MERVLGGNLSLIKFFAQFNMSYKKTYEEIMNALNSKRTLMKSRTAINNNKESLYFKKSDYIWLTENYDLQISLMK